MLRYNFYLCICFIPIVISQTGCKNERVGIDQLRGKKVIGGLPDKYFLACAKDYVSICCARVTSWRYGVDVRNPVDMFIWRNINTTFYEVITIETGKPTLDTNTHLPTIRNVIIRNGDCLGWKADGDEVIGYENGNDGIQVKYMEGITPSIGSVIDWSTATSSAETDLEYAINARVLESNSPTFPTQTTTYYIQDIDTAGTVAVSSFIFNDVDVKDTLTLTMISTPSDYLTLTDNDNGNGTLRLSRDVKLISGQTITVTVYATDACGKRETATLSIVVRNDPPVLTGLLASVTVPECLNVEQLLDNFTCSDSTGVVTVTITEVPARTRPFFYTIPIEGQFEFKVVAKSQLNAATGNRFDYDTLTSHSVIITCQDGAGASVSGTMTVSIIRNNPPVIDDSMPSVIYINKTDRVGDVIYTVPYNDTEGDQATLSLTPTTAPFTVFDDGEIQVTQDIIDINQTTWNVDIGIADAKHTGTPKTLTIIVTGIGIPLSFANLPKHVTVPENSPLSTSLYQVLYAGTPITMHWSNPDGGTVLFGFNKADGKITTLSALNYEALNPPTYLMVVELANNLTTASGTITIEVTDVNEPLGWSSTIYRSNIIERQGIGVEISDPGFRIDDPDKNDPHKCVMDCGTYNMYYTMNELTCKVTVAAVYSLDASLPTTVTCNLTATDTKPHTATSTLIITIDYANNHAPVFTNTTGYTYSISPYIGIDAFVGNVTATDEDIGDFGIFSYSIINQPNPHYFTIEASSGLISTASTLLAVCPNCTGSILILRVTATDRGGLIATSTVTIEIQSLTTVNVIVTERYLKFADDERNIVWLTFAVALLVISIVVGSYICFKYVIYYEGKWCNFRRGMVRWEPPDDVDISPSPQLQHFDSDMVSCRPKVPQGGHAWQREMMF